jgi:hypothetical protein
MICFFFEEFLCGGLQTGVLCFLIHIRGLILKVIFRPIRKMGYARSSLLSFCAKFAFSILL